MNKIARRWPVVAWPVAATLTSCFRRVYREGDSKGEIQRPLPFPSFFVVVAASFLVHVFYCLFFIFYVFNPLVLNIQIFYSLKVLFPFALQNGLVGSPVIQFFSSGLCCKGLGRMFKQLPTSLDSD